ncbi:hypothetical protein [Neoroseomonas rubea]|uniref:hypothetical protein n=1 Tax=Neoroseomonas rubea TaxID=2748666 RepID=UPI0018E05A72|nr:hypothetical protein [Roseomonas rubea]
MPKSLPSRWTSFEGQDHGFQGVCDASNFSTQDHRGTLRVALYRARVTGSAAQGTVQGTVQELMVAGRMALQPVATIDQQSRADWLGW